MIGKLSIPAREKGRKGPSLKAEKSKSSKAKSAKLFDGTATRVNVVNDSERISDRAFDEIPKKDNVSESDIVNVISQSETLEKFDKSAAQLIPEKSAPAALPESQYDVAFISMKNFIDPISLETPGAASPTGIIGNSIRDST
jgi:hypothetical protein